MDPFEPYIKIAKRLSASEDPAHDFLHVHRVFKNGQAILKMEKDADQEVVLIAILLHEVFNFPKNHPLSSKSGDVSAMLAEDILIENQCEGQKIPRILNCIRNHSFSKGVSPQTLEEKIVQDADRLDAIGAIGIARLFATCEAMNRPFYDQEDPFAEYRQLNDKAFGVDHFYKKLLTLGDSMHTPAAKQMAETRMKTMKHYLEQLSSEI